MPRRSGTVDRTGPVRVRNLTGVIGVSGRCSAQPGRAVTARERLELLEDPMDVPEEPGAVGIGLLD